MAMSLSEHLIVLNHQIKGWDLYKRTVKKGGTIVSETYRAQIKQSGKVVNAQARVTSTMVKGQQKISKSVSYTSAAMKQSTAASNDLMKALRRAAIVAPVWLALRSVMMKTIRTITDGAKAWEKWDEALIKSKAVIHTTSMDISTAYIRLQDEVEKLSIRTGVSLDKVTNAFFRFGTLGIEFEDSLAGMTASMNIALTMGGDLEQVARPLAFAYKLLGDTMDQTIPVHERMEILGSKMFAIWKINAFEINEFSQSLNNFLPTANTANFTIDETVTLLTALSSSAILGARGGRLLRQSVLRLVGNLDTLASQLGMAVNPQMESTNEILLKVLGRIKELGETGTTAKAAKALTAIFGGARMGEAARGLISVYNLIQENTAIMTASGDELDRLLKKQVDRLKEVEDSLHRQLKVGRNLTTQLGRVFLKGIFGGKEYAETIKNINKAKRGMLPIIESLASTTKDWLLGAQDQGGRFLAILQRIINKQKELTITPEEVAVGMKFRPELGRYITPESSEPYEKEEKDIKRLNTENQIKLNLLQKGLEISKLEALGISKSQKIYKSLTAEVKERVKQHNELIDLEKLGFKQLEEKQILLLLEGREYEKILELGGENIFTQDKLLELAKQQSDFEAAAFKEKQTAIKLLITHETNLLKIRGATSRQLIEAAMAMNVQLRLGQDSLSLLKNQLALEQEITKEKTGQTKLSAETMNLYEASQKIQFRFVRAAAEWARKGFDISKFESWNRKMKAVAKSIYGTVIEKKLAERWAERMKVPTKEREALKVLKTPSEIQKRVELLPKISMPDLKLPAITTKINKIEVNIKTALKEALDEKGVSQNILDALAEAIRNNPKIREALDEKIEEY